MNVIDFEDFVSFVVEEESMTSIKVNGSMMMEVRHELLLSGIACDFSPGAIESFADHFPQNVKVSHFEIEIHPNKDFAHRLWQARPVKEEYRLKIPSVWKKVNK